ncbi:transmembrane amino acid transporter protein-domain-containing protein [Thelonectria olida]|uniref:Transmembrane amino acid transporter protein-domain-containing protein n=1 Tax=Thelonectria olida TaxID=1576542 RepID=A0A9P8VZ98_9HYPO|nr:transmembrane amino acid transporter protein-domain-containing protein [Thelonectria olida]
MLGETNEVDDDRLKRIAAEGNAYFHRLGWKRLSVILVVEAIALGSLSLPGAFHTLGMILGVILTIFLGIVAIFTSYIVGRVKLAYPEISHYADAGRMLFGRVGYEVFGAAFVLELLLTVGSHALTGSIALVTINGGHVCSIAFSAVSAIILLILAIPPSFSEVAILGYVDFVSIIAAIGVTIIATGIQATDSPKGLSGVDWSAYPKDDLSFSQAFVAVSNIVFAYSFAIGQFSFMDEMHTPKDYMKSIWANGITQILIYTLTGAICYAFIGSTVQSPALLSAGTLVSKVAFGLALPVIFISGSINTTVALRYVHGRMFKNSIIRYINTPMGWASWVGIVSVFTIIAWIIAEAIPIFSDLLSLASALFVSGFSFYIPGLMWFRLLCKGKWYSRKNILISIGSIISFIIGIVVLGAGTYSTIKDIIDQVTSGTDHAPFTCRSV